MAGHRGLQRPRDDDGTVEDSRVCPGVWCSGAVGDLGPSKGMGALGGAVASQNMLRLLSAPRGFLSFFLFLFTWIVQG